MLVLLVIVVLIILSLMFGGFQKGTKSGGLGPLAPGPVGSGVHGLRYTGSVMALIQLVDAAVHGRRRSSAASCHGDARATVPVGPEVSRIRATPNSGFRPMITAGA